MIVRFYQGWFQMLYLDLPLFLASTCSVSSFYMVAQRELYPREWRSRIKYIPFLMATGIGLAVTNAKAVIEAIVRQAVGVRAHPQIPRGRARRGLGTQEVRRRRAGWIPFVELGLAGYFLFTTAYSLTAENYLTTPFLLLFFMGYSYMGTMSLFQTPLRRLAGALPGLLRLRSVEHAT